MSWSRPHTRSHALPAVALRAAAGATLALMASLAAAPAAAQVPGPSVDADWLVSNLSHPDLVLLHVGGDGDQFAAGHIPGARYFSVGSIVYSRGSGADEDRISVDLPEDLEAVRKAFEGAGISDDSQVVVYLAEEQPTYLGTRTLWTLDLMGLGDQSALLDGGLSAWRAAGNTVAEGEAADFPPGTLTMAPLEGRLATLDWLTDNLDDQGVAVVDGRRTAAYTGEREEIPGRAGHIPGAGSLPIEELFNDGGLLKGADELRSIFARAGVEEGDTVVAYCHVGLRASVLVYAARVAGFQTLLYDGSMTEWSRARDLPLISGTEPR